MERLATYASLHFCFPTEFPLRYCVKYTKWHAIGIKHEAQPNYICARRSFHVKQVGGEQEGSLELRLNIIFPRLLRIFHALRDVECLIRARFFFAFTLIAECFL